MAAHTYNIFKIQLAFCQSLFIKRILPQVQDWPNRYIKLASGGLPFINISGKMFF